MLKGLLLNAAISLCQTEDTKNLGSVVEFLRASDFLRRLDSKDDYDYQPQLRIERILIEIGKLSGAKAENVLLSLGENEVIMAHPRRRDAIVMATGKIRHPSKKLFDFLDAQAKTKSVQVYTVVAALGTMRSPKALQRIEEWFHTSELHTSSKIGWFTQELIQHRNDPAIVALYERLLKGRIEDRALRSVVVQSLFDYRPREWYEPSHIAPPRPPFRREASTEVLQQLLVIADQSVQLDISEDTKEGVRKARTEVEAILKFRQDGGPEHITKLISQLDDKSFPVREHATRELEKYGDWAEPALRAALERTPTLEAQRRIQTLLSKLKK